MTIDTDVLVCGGGCAGLGAALAAARNGVKTILVERAGFAGGIITCAGLPFFDGIAHRPTGKVVVRGIAIELLSRMGVCKPDAEIIKPHNPMIPHTDRFKLLAEQLLVEQRERLRVSFHSFNSTRGRYCAGDGDLVRPLRFGPWAARVGVLFPHKEHCH